MDLQYSIAIAHGLTVFDHGPMFYYVLLQEEGVIVVVPGPLFLTYDIVLVYLSHSCTLYCIASLSQSPFICIFHL